MFFWRWLSTTRGATSVLYILTLDTSELHLQLCNVTWQVGQYRRTDAWLLGNMARLKPGAGCRVPGAGCRVPLRFVGKPPHRAGEAFLSKGNLC